MSTSPESAPAPCPESPTSQTSMIVLDVDQHLLRAAIHESAQLADQLLRQRLPLHLAQPLSQMLIRLTYFLLHSPVPNEDRSQYVLMHRAGLHALRDALEASRDSLSNSSLNQFLSRRR